MAMVDENLKQRLAVQRGLSHGKTTWLTEVTPSLRTLSDSSGSIWFSSHSMSIHDDSPLAYFSRSSLTESVELARQKI